MGLYNFQPRFLPFILSGAKRHTIRAVRAHPDKPGNTLYLYTGLRTKAVKPILTVKCTKVEEIVIEMQPNKGNVKRCDYGKPYPFFYQPGRELLFPHVIVNGEDLASDELEDLARRDGFTNFADMMRFWTQPKNRLPFTGHIIHWSFPGEPPYNRPR